jgi:hypothetical protein
VHSFFVAVLGSDVDGCVTALVGRVRARAVAKEEPHHWHLVLRCSLDQCGAAQVSLRVHVGTVPCEEPDDGKPASPRSAG